MIVSRARCHTFRELEKAANEIAKTAQQMGERLSLLEYTERNSRKEMPVEEQDRLLNLNRQLRMLETFLAEKGEEAHQELFKTLDDPTHAMCDFDLEYEMSFIMRETDPEWQEDDDNILTTRKSFLGNSLDRFPEGDFREYLEGLPGIGSEPHCYLFHDLHDHGNGYEQPALPLRACHRVGKIWIDIIRREQYFLDVDTGKWWQAEPRVIERKGK